MCVTWVSDFSEGIRRLNFPLSSNPPPPPAPRIRLVCEQNVRVPREKYTHRLWNEFEFEFIYAYE